jgi:hypothetical protein
MGEMLGANAEAASKKLGSFALPILGPLTAMSMKSDGLSVRSILCFGAAVFGKRLIDSFIPFLRSCCEKGSLQSNIVEQTSGLTQRMLSLTANIRELQTPSVTQVADLAVSGTDLATYVNRAEEVVGTLEQQQDLLRNETIRAVTLGQRAIELVVDIRGNQPLADDNALLSLTETTNQAVMRVGRYIDTAERVVAVVERHQGLLKIAVRNPKETMMGALYIVFCVLKALAAPKMMDTLEGITTVIIICSVAKKALEPIKRRPLQMEGAS